MAIRRLPNGRYEHDYRVDGKRRYKRFRTKGEAQAHDLEVRTARAGGTLVDTRKGGKIRFQDLYEEWIARIEKVGARGSRPSSPVTVAGYRRIYKSHMKPHLENRVLATISLTVINDWLETFSTDDARQRSYRQLGRMLEYAVGRGYLAANPARNATINHVQQPEPVRDPAALTAAQLQSFAEQAANGGRYAGAAHDVYRLLILFAGTTGLRWSEIAGLYADALTFGDKPQVIVRTTLVPVDGRLQFRETTKSRKLRKVPIPKSIAALLEDHLERTHLGGLVFTSPTGAPLRSSNFARRVFQPAVERCRADDPTFPNMVFHDLRRTAVTLAISAGANVKVVQQIAGHSSATTTLDVYAQLFADDAHASASAVDELLNSATVQRP
ncbi:tyrosine-type recombinase/integrase [Paenarthrobacter sp. CM16]|uniref:tyrosine-type recombinase/integrase n=1 Tax=Paenarthrobacter sp. CM16 TaxID=2738447 RepID=UPI001557027A|nr:tyrosine-type recombinase/integrase [Paenarthrobacter sp. CM16]NQD87174.1 tyrosine-type recombinase/integrase [Paenarthrobacter sp. CM16]